MSGVIDDYGVQWEHCDECLGFVRIERLNYTAPSVKHEYGQQLCDSCYRREVPA